MSWNFFFKHQKVALTLFVSIVSVPVKINTTIVVKQQGIKTQTAPSVMLG